MLRTLLSLLRILPRPQVIDIESFGPRFSFPELELILQTHPEVLRAIQQVNCFRRQVSQRAVELKSNLPDHQTAFESGAASGLTDLMATLENIRHNRSHQEPELKAWFGEPTRTKPNQPEPTGTATL
jgi:hypothetical protein